MKPHRTDGVSLSFGVIFLLVALWWAVSRVVNIHLPAIGWLVAGALILFGVIGLLGAIRSGRRTVPEPVHATATTGPAEPTAAVETPGDLPPEMHASIVRELLDDPTHRFQREHPDVEPGSADRS
jgi:Na+-transporting methylmalonyl-CoA/oxaloacetate decarboxylase gamma subunit